MDLLHEALRAAEEQSQINRIVTVASWPLRLMVPIDTKVAKQHLERFIALANQEPHTLRRANALFALANAMAAEDKLLAVVVPSLAGALVHSYGWRTDRLIAWSVEMVGRTLPEAVPALVARHRPGSKRRRLEQWMAANVIHT